MQHWYCVYTKPHTEHHVSAFLESRDFDTYLPTLRVRKRGRSKTKPFFSCYLFLASTLRMPFQMHAGPLA